MKAKSKLIIVLFVLLGLIALIFLVPRHNEIPQVNSQTKIFSVTDRNDLSRIRFAGALGSYDLNKTSILKTSNPIFERSDWVLREPLFAPIAEERIKELINIVFELAGEEVPVASVPQDKMAEYGLLPPSIVLILNFGDKKEVLSFGSTNSVTNQFFIQKENSENLYLVKDDVLRKIQEILSQLRSYQVLKFDPSNVQQVDVVTGNTFYRLVSDCEKVPTWKATAEGLNMKADSSLVARELKELSEISVRRIYDNPLDILEFTGLSTPILVFKLIFKSEKSEMMCEVGSPKEMKTREVLFQIGKGTGINLEVGSAQMKSTYYLKINGENIIYEIDKGTFGDWLQSVAHFRDKQPFESMKLSDYQKVEIVTPEQNCANITEIENVKGIDELFRKFKSLKLDVLLSPSEIAQYEKVNGMKVDFFDKQNCNQALEVVGALKQRTVDGQEVQVASVLRINKCGELQMYGVAPFVFETELRAAAIKSCEAR